MDITLREKRIGQFFRFSVALKGIHSLLEIMGGLLLLIASPERITRLVIWMTQDELLEEPRNFIANYLLNTSSHLSINSILFGSFYLLSHGVVKLVLVIGLLKNKLWAYPWSLVVLGLFMVYQIYRFSFTHSAGLLVLTVFDGIVLWLIWREYQIIRSHKQSELPLS